MCHFNSYQQAVWDSIVAAYLYLVLLFQSLVVIFFLKFIIDKTNEKLIFFF